MFGAAAVRNKKRKAAAAANAANAPRGPYIKPFGPRFDPEELPYFKYKRALAEAKELQENIAKAKKARREEAKRARKERAKLLRGEHAGLAIQAHLATALAEEGGGPVAVPLNKGGGRLKARFRSRMIIISRLICSSPLLVFVEKCPKKRFVHISGMPLKAAFTRSWGIERKNEGEKQKP